MNKNLKYVIIGIIVLAAVIFWAAGSKKPSVSVGPTPISVSGQPTKIFISGASIVKAVTSRSIDAKGNATGETATFNAQTDKIVYVVLTLKNATPKTQLSYVRSLNGKYIDSKVAQPSKNGTTNFYFTFKKGTGNYPKGTYTVKLYVDGKRATDLNYVFK